MNIASPLSINLFLAEGHCGGLVVADAPAQNAKLLCLPRARLHTLLDRDDLQRSGVYVLTGPNLEAGFGLASYVGESDRIAQRLRSHARTKAFWSRAYVAVAKDSWLSKSHIRFLESRLIQEALRAPLLTRVENAREEQEYEAIGDSDKASLESLMAFLAIIMPAVGCPLFPFPDRVPMSAGAQPTGARPSAAQTHFEMSRGPARALGYFLDDNFWVCKGSSARQEVQSSMREGYRTARAALLDKGLLVRDEMRGVLIFQQDVPFNSPSDAAAIVGTASLNGRKEWKVLGTRLSLADWERTQDEA